MTDRIVLQVREGDSKILAIRAHASRNAFLRISRSGPDSTDVLPLVDVLQHWRGRQVFASRDAGNQAVEAFAILVGIRDDRELVLKLAGPGRLPLAFPERPSDAARRRNREPAEVHVV